MLAPALVHAVKQLLAEGRQSQRSIARRLGVSRGTVHCIALGRRPDYEAMRRKKLEQETPQGPPRRCPSCGGTVYWPCRLCSVRKHQAECSHSYRNGREEPLQLQLRPEHQTRYEQVRLWRRQNTALPLEALNTNS